MSGYLIQVATVATIYSVLALSLNLQYGLTGLLNFGQSFFLALGGYSIGVVYFHSWPAWIGLAAAPFVGALGGLLMALPARRLDDHYWALMTLGVAELFLAVVKNEASIAGGELGTYGIPAVGSSMLLPLMGGFAVLVFAAFELIRRSQFGRVIRTVREDPVLVAALGRSAFRFRAAVLALGGAVGATAGVALAYWLTLVASDVFSLEQTVLVWAMVIIGGRGNNLGVIVGAFVVQAIYIGSQFMPDSAPVSGEGFALLRIFVIGLAMVLVLLFRNEGLIPEWKVRRRRPT
jgi:branched-chain amino acid transport system permease protein